MPRPALPIGTYGAISVVEDPASTKSRPLYIARARFRDTDGKIRHVKRGGQTKTAATNNLKEALTKRVLEVGSGGVTSATRVSKLIDLWIEDVHASDVSVNTKRLYEGTARRHLEPRLGGLRLSEVTTGRCDDALNDIATTVGKPTARTCRAVLSNIMRFAARKDAIDVNPVRETITPTPQTDPARALTRGEVDELTDAIRAFTRRTPPGWRDQSVPELDIADIVDLMLATGVRLGEALAIREVFDKPANERCLDLDAGVVEINATVIRVPKRGLVVQERPKSAAGHRVLALPSYAVTMLRHRRDLLRLHPRDVALMNDREQIRRVPGDRIVMVFPSPKARALRDPSNTSGDLRMVLDAIGCEHCDGTGKQLNPDGTFARNEKGHQIRCDKGPWSWVTSHTFRKTVATRLDEAGRPAREVADQLGHAQPSMTLNVYLGRKVVSSVAAEALDR